MTPHILLPGSPAIYANYVRAVAQSGGQLCCDSEAEAFSHFDGLLLPGGGDMEPSLYGQSTVGSHPPDFARDTRELALAEQCLSAGCPILGICRGLQVLNVLFGGTLVQDLPAHGQVDGADTLHPVETVCSSLLRTLYGSCFSVNSAHHQAADRPGAGLAVLARAPDGVIEALSHRTLPVLAVQWHPERLTGQLARSGTADGRPLFDAFVSACRRRSCDAQRKGTLSLLQGRADAGQI